MKKSLEILFTVGLVLVLAATIYLLWGRVSWEAENRQFAVALSYENLINHSQRNAESLSRILTSFKEAGLSTITISGESLNNLDSKVEADLHLFRRMNLKIGVELEQDHLQAVSQPEQVKSNLNEIAPMFLGLGEIPLSKSSPLKEWITSHKPLLAVVEFKNNELASQLANQGYKNFTRLHKIFEKEVDSTTIEEATDRYVRAVKERNIGIIQWRLLPWTTPDQNVTALKGLGTELRKSGYSISNSLLQVKGMASSFTPPRWIYLPLVGLAIGLFWYYLYLLIPAINVRSATVLGTVSLFGAGLALMFLPLLTRQLSALTLAVFGPLILYPMVAPGEENYSDTTPLFNNRLIHSWVKLVVASLIMTLIGLSLAALLSDSTFFLKLHQFRGVKVSLVLPFLLILILMVREGRFKIFSTDFSPLRGVLLFVLGGGIIFILLRSGNFSFVPIASVEQAIRQGLEDLLVVRPRFKEFFIGHPALVLLFYFQRKMKPNLEKTALILVGILGQMSILNTFAHIHTPLPVSLLRTANGILWGIVISIVALILIVGGNKIWTNLNR